MVDEFENLIDYDMSVVEIKINKVNPDDVDEDVLSTVWNYVMDLVGHKIYFSSAGVHLNGESKVPHIHYTFITGSFKQYANWSDHRKKWLKKNKDDFNERAFENVSMKVYEKMDSSKPKYSVLAYPLKEGLQISQYLKGIMRFFI